MKDNKIKLTLYGQAAFEALAAIKNPDMALVYMYMCSNDGTCSYTEAAKALDFDEVRLSRTMDLLILYDIAALEGLSPPRVRSEPAPADLAHEREVNSAFRGLCSYYESLKGDILKKAELQTLYNIYSTLNLPADVLILLINYCKSIERLSPREVERQAYFWHDHGIDTYEKAGKYLTSQNEKRSRIYTITRCLGINDRKLSPTERKYVEAWAEMPVEEEIFTVAYDRTVVRTGKLGWNYMDAILKNWMTKNVRSVSDIENLDKEYVKGPQQKPTVKKQESAESIVMAQYNEKRRHREMRLKSRLTEMTRLSADFAENEKQLKICAGKIARASEQEKIQLNNLRQELMRQRVSILENAGKPADYLDNSPDCRICGDHGYIGTKMCDCFKREVEKLKTAQE